MKHMSNSNALTSTYTDLTQDRPGGGTTNLIRKEILHRNPPSLKIFNTNIAWKNDIEYFCVILDSKLVYRSHTNNGVKFIIGSGKCIPSSASPHPSTLTLL